MALPESDSSANCGKTVRPSPRHSPQTVRMEPTQFRRSKALKQPDVFGHT